MIINHKLTAYELDSDSEESAQDQADLQPARGLRASGFLKQTS